MDAAPAANSPEKRSSWKPIAAAGCLGMIAGAIGLLAALLIAYGFFQKQAVQKMAEVKELKPVQLRADYDWTLTKPDGSSLDMASLKGKPIFLHLWRPECVSCVAEVPGINALYADYASKGVAFVTIALGATEDLAGQLQMHAVDFPVYTVEAEKLPPLFSPASTPATWIISRAGFILYSHTGAVEWDSPDSRAFLDQLAAE